LADALDGSRDVVGVRDPFIWGARDPRQDFGTWVDLYLQAIVERQPEGPYYLCAYSSAGAFGYELALKLQNRGREVKLLALVDPLVLDNQRRSHFGYWVARSRFMPPARSRAFFLAGKLCAPLRSALGAVRSAESSQASPLTQEQFEQLAWEGTHDRGHILTLSALFELNTSLPFALSDADLAGKTAGEYLGVLQERVRQLTPEVEVSHIERIAIQYKLQLRAQNYYRLRRYEGDVLLVEPEGPYGGLVATQLAPHVRRLRALRLTVGPPSHRIESVCSTFGRFATHYRTMRDDSFTRGLAKVLSDALM
jgi:thioesterase domain-containing protein